MSIEDGDEKGKGSMRMRVMMRMRMRVRGAREEAGHKIQKGCG